MTREGEPCTRTAALNCCFTFARDTRRTGGPRQCARDRRRPSSVVRHAPRVCFGAHGRPAEFLFRKAAFVPLASNQIVIPVTAAQAIANYRASVFTPPQSIADTAANVAADLDQLQQLALAGDIVSIRLTDTPFLSIPYAAYVADLAAVATLTSGTLLILSAVPAARAVWAQANTNVASFAVTDDRNAIVAGLNTLNATPKLTAIALTDAGAITISGDQYDKDTFALVKLPPDARLVVTAAKAADAIALQADPRVTSFSVTDTAAAIAVVLNMLNAMTKLTSIGLTDTAPLPITVTQLNNDSAAIALLPADATFLVDGVKAASAASVQADMAVVGFSVSDTAADVTANLTALNGDGELRTVLLTDTAPIALTMTQLTMDAELLGKLSPGYTLTVSLVTASGAAGVQANAHVRSFSVSDGTANVFAALDALGADNLLTSIALTDTQTATIGFARYQGAGTILSKIGGAWTISVTAASAAGAAAVQADPHVGSFTLSDSPASVGAVLDALNADGKLTWISLTGTAPMTVTAGQYAADTLALGKIITAPQLNVTGAAVGDLTALHANSHVTAIQISDSASNILAALPALNMDPLVTSITLSQGASLTVSYQSWTLNGLALAKLNPVDALVVSDVPVFDAAAVQRSARVSAFVVSDSEGTIEPLLDALNADGKLTSIVLTDMTTLYLPFATLINDASAVNKLSAADSLIVAGVPVSGVASVARNPHVGTFSVLDTLSDIGAKLDQLEVAASLGKLTSISVLGGGAEISIPAGRYVADADAIALLQGSFTIARVSPDGWSTASLSWDPLQAAASAAFSAMVTGAAPYFTPAALTGFMPGAAIASASSGLDAPSLTFLGAPLAVDAVPVTDVGLSTGAGINEIAGFRYGVDAWRIDLTSAGASALPTFDTSVGGQQAIALANAADLTHGLALTGMPATATAADLIANHITSAGGQALIT